MTLIDLGQYRHRDIGIILRHLLARHERGELKGLALCCKDTNNHEELSFTGEYKIDSARAQSASLKMYRRTSEIEDDQQRQY